MGVGLPPIYAIIISLAIYFGIRIFVGRRKKMIEESVGEGICVKCGSKIENKKCPISVSYTHLTLPTILLV